MFAGSPPLQATGAAPGSRLMPRTVAPVRRAGRPTFVFEPLSAFAGFQEAAATGARRLGIPVFFLGGWCALAAEFLHTRTDRRKVIGSAGSGHVSSSSLAEPRRGSCLLINEIFRPCWRMGWARASKNQGIDSKRFRSNVTCTFAAMSLNGNAAEFRAASFGLCARRLYFVAGSTPLVVQNIRYTSHHYRGSRRWDRVAPRAIMSLH